MQGNVLSNVIGAPFNQYIIDQLKIRSANGSTQNRSPEQILYLANKMSWTRLTSSVKIKPIGVLGLPTPLSKFYANLFNGEIPPGDYSQSESLAKNWILQGGTTEYNNGTYNLRYGLGPNSAYGLGGIEEQGYRPMPGLTSVTIDTKGTLGSLREATINFSVWNMIQLNVVEALYFRLGYTMLLEWGHVNYFTNREPTPEFVTNPYGIDFFSYKSKEDIFQAITERNQRTNGNYEAMLGTVTNFFFSFNSQGGYDCSVKLIGLGSIIDTIKVNQTFVMPESLGIQIQQARDINEKNAADQLRKKDAQTRIGQGKPGTILPVVTDLTSLKVIYESTAKVRASDDWVKTISFSSTQFIATTGTASTDYYFKANGTSPLYNDELNNDPNNIGADRTGLFLNKNARRQNWQRIPVNISPVNPQPVKLDLTLLNSLAVFDRQFYVGATSNSKTITYKTGLSDIILNVGDYLEPNKNITDLDIAGAFDTALTKATNRLYSSPIPKVKDGGPANFTVVIPYAAGIEQKFYAFIVPLSQGSTYYTREDYINTLTLWFRIHGTVNIDDIQTVAVLNQRDVIIHGITQDLYIGTELTKAQFITNDPGLISQVLPRPPKTGSPTPQQGSAVNPQGQTEGAENQTTPAQAQQVEKFASSLHTMLTAVGEIGRSKAVNNTDAVISIDLTETTKIFYNSGVLQNVLNAPNQNTLNNQIANNIDIFGARQRNLNLFDSNLISSDFNLTTYAIKGFNSNLMADKANFAKIQDIVWSDLCTAYYVAYEFADNETMTSSTAEKPVYIKLGYLLAFLNNMCLLYESTTKDNNSKGSNLNTVKPYVYIDFHPEYNLCLTSPLHMTIDPYKCLIPLAASDSEYVSFFKDVNAKDILGADIFKPTKENTLSKGLKGFKTDNAYRGKTMEILLNTQYLLDLANRYITSDKFSALNLKPFLDSLMDDVSKSTGNFNMFRVAYRDDSNTIIIKDDQWTPNLSGETSVITQKDYLANRKYMELQVFGSGSLVRDMEFRTNMTTKMSAMIAISAQSGTQVANGTNASPIGTYNINYEDSIMAIKQDASSGSIGRRNNTKLTKEQQDEEAKKQQQILDTNNDAAIKFNNYVRAVYFGGRIPTSQTNSVAKYYQDRLTTKKGTDPVTQASEFIPANLSITLDGISGIVMGNAFTIPENRLPATLRGDNGFSKVGFVVVGLTHTLESNQWLTKIRGQMIKLRQKVDIATTKIDSSNNTFKYPLTTSGGLSAIIKGKELTKNQAFRDKLKKITDSFQISDEDLLKIMYKESGLNPAAALYVKRNRTVAGPLQQNNPAPGYELFGGGLVGFTAVTLKTIGANSIEEVIQSDALRQLDFVEALLKANAKNIRGADIYVLYTSFFLPAFIPALKAGRDSEILKFGNVTAERVSLQNTPIARAAGKTPGTPLTVGDFRKYVTSIL